MENLLITFLSTFLFTTVGYADTGMPAWWGHEKVCRINPSECYTPSEIGSNAAAYDMGMWDAERQCWGMKLICAAAVVNAPDSKSPSYGAPIPISREFLERQTSRYINSGFDISKRDGDCFGVRQIETNNTVMVPSTSAGGTATSRRVWCDGILADVDERVDNGEITYGAEPTCSELARDGYVAVETSKKCWGKYFDPYEYHIECNAADTGVLRLIKLNGATNSPVTASAPVSMKAAVAVFDKMESVSKQQHSNFLKK